MSTAAFRDFEKAAHGRLATSYDDAFTPVAEHAIEPLLRCAMVGEGTCLLDVASGPGELTARAAQRGAEVIGVDIAPEMVALALRKHPGLRFQEAPAEALPFGSAAFDAVTCAFGLGHFAEPEAVMREFVRVLRPGGRAALSWWQGFSCNRINGIFFDVLQRLQIASALPPGPPVDRFSQPDRLRSLLEGAGLADVDVEEVSSVHRLPATADLWSLAMGSFARVSTIIRAQRVEEQERIRDAVAEETRRYHTEAGIAVPIAFFVAAGRVPA